jgi:hypothetical protein
MHPVTWAILISSLVFIGTLLGLEFGYRQGASDTKGSPQSHEGISAVESSAFALFGLLLAYAAMLALTGGHRC